MRNFIAGGTHFLYISYTCTTSRYIRTYQVGMYSTVNHRGKNRFIRATTRARSPRLVYRQLGMRATAIKFLVLEYSAAACKRNTRIRGPYPN